MVAATLAVAVTLLLYAGIRWGWPFILIGLVWFFFLRRATPRSRGGGMRL